MRGIEQQGTAFTGLTTRSAIFLNSLPKKIIKVGLGIRGDDGSLLGKIQSIQPPVGAWGPTVTIKWQNGKTGSGLGLDWARAYILSPQELTVQEILGHFNERWPAMGASEGVFAFEQLFALMFCLGNIELVAGNNRSFAGTAG